MEWFRKIKAGDVLIPIPDWNRTERNGNQLPDQVQIVRTVEAKSQSGVMFMVRTKGGLLRSLDAFWFLEPDNK